jgi:hypothetical protein
MENRVMDVAVTRTRRQAATRAAEPEPKRHRAEPRKVAEREAKL